MVQRSKNKITTYVFLFILAAIFISNLLTPIQALSYAERRTLKNFSTLDLSLIPVGGFSEAFDATALDQFILRQPFRSLKAHLSFGLFHKRDNNGIAVIDDQIFKSDYPYDPNETDHFTHYMNNFYDRYLQKSKVYIAVIPDKSHYLPSKDNLLTLDYTALTANVYKALDRMTPIDLSNALKLEDYYRTDAHWKQENLIGVLSVLKEALELKTDFVKTSYTQKSFYPFYGGYYGQSALPVKPDTLTYLTNADLEQVTVTYYGLPENPLKTSGIYTLHKLGKMDSYDVFLSGAAPLVILDNPKSKTNKELIIIRDSFASSLSPLLSQAYAKITLVDLRYVSQDLIGNYVDFKNKEVLILLSTSIIQKSQVFK